MSAVLAARARERGKRTHLVLHRHSLLRLNRTRSLRRTRLCALAHLCHLDRRAVLGLALLALALARAARAARALPLPLAPDPLLPERALLALPRLAPGADGDDRQVAVVLLDRVEEDGRRAGLLGRGGGSGEQDRGGRLGVGDEALGDGGWCCEREAPVSVALRPAGEEGERESSPWSAGGAALGASAGWAGCSTCIWTSLVSTAASPTCSAGALMVESGRKDGEEMKSRGRAAAALGRVRLGQARC